MMEDGQTRTCFLENGRKFRCDSMFELMRGEALAYFGGDLVESQPITLFSGDTLQSYKLSRAGPG